MEIYIEYALLENVFFDGVLLYLALKASKTPVKKGRWICSAFLGAVFAVVFPLLRLPNFLLYAWKFAFGFLLCLIASPPVKTKKEWGRYALTVVFFFTFSFGFGGVLLGTLQEFFDGKVPTVFVTVAFLVLTGFSVFFVKKLYAKRALHRFIYECEISYKEKRIGVTGFLDSGNLAQKNGLPVCFLSPDICYALWGEETIEGGGQGCDEMQISTLGGEKSIALYKGVVEINENGLRIKKQTYFASSTNMLSREYKMILSSYIAE